MRSMPQYSHMMWPSSRWNESTRAVAVDVQQLVDPVLDGLLGRGDRGVVLATVSNGPAAR